ncbi:hypothetical protein ACHAWO_001577 [Cyclotella atomus]|uniref:peptidylprolyl isomerase n=1 Tax=Cyclotella atomus TaxID=382360 RepID=A0ABD3Q5I5_9STRA
MKSTCLLLASLMASATSFTPSPQTRTTTSLSAHQLSRSQLLQNAAAAATALTILPLPSSADDDSVTVTPSGITIKVLKSGNGPAPDIGELAAIRFASYAGENKIDNIFDTAEPYYTRVGSGGLIKGVEEVLPKMRLGDRWVLTIPGNLAFGPKGRPASAGTPRIPANAEIIFDVEMVGLPGKEPELIDIIGD